MITAYTVSSTFCEETPIPISSDILTTGYLIILRKYKVVLITFITLFIQIMPVRSSNLLFPFTYLQEAAAGNISEMLDTGNLNLCKLYGEQTLLKYHITDGKKVVWH